MPAHTTNPRANGAAAGAHNPTSPGLRPGTSLQAVLAARASATPTGGRGAAANVTPSPHANVGTDIDANTGGVAPEEGTAAAAVLEGATMEIADLVATVTAANQAVTASATELCEYLLSGAQTVVAVIDEFLHLLEVFVDDFIQIAQTDDVAALRGLSRKLMTAVHSIFPPTNQT